MEEKDKIIVKWAQEDVETSNNMLNKLYIYICIYYKKHTRTFRDWSQQKYNRVSMTTIMFSMKDFWKYHEIQVYEWVYVPA